MSASSGTQYRGTLERYYCHVTSSIVNDSSSYFDKKSNSISKWEEHVAPKPSASRKMSLEEFVTEEVHISFLCYLPAIKVCKVDTLNKI